MPSEALTQNELYTLRKLSHDTKKSLEEVTGDFAKDGQALTRSTVSKRLKRLIALGLCHRAKDGHQYVYWLSQDGLAKRIHHIDDPAS